MAVPEADLIWIRTKIGDKPVDADVEVVYNRNQYDKRATAAEILERRRANLLANPASFSISGKYSQDTRTNIEELKDALGDVAGVNIIPAPDPECR